MGKQAADFRNRIQEAGGAVKNIYWTMGRYDGVIVFDAPDEATAAAVRMGGCAKGSRNINFLEFAPRFMSDWVDLREHHRRRRKADVEDGASENRLKLA